MQHYILASSSKHRGASPGVNSLRGSTIDTTLSNSDQIYTHGTRPNNSFTIKEPFHLQLEKYLNKDLRISREKHEIWEEFFANEVEETSTEDCQRQVSRFQSISLI